MPTVPRRRFPATAPAALRLTFVQSQQKERITIQTGAGLKTCTLTGRSDSEYEFEVEMGAGRGGSGTHGAACDRESSRDSGFDGKSALRSLCPAGCGELAVESGGDPAESAIQTGCER